MNAVAVIGTTQVPVPTLEQWLEIGRAIADEGRRVGWAFADWARQGKDLGYTKQLGFNFIGHELGIDPRRLEIIDKAADAFPPGTRHPKLSVEHHAHVADLPKERGFELLNEAAANKWTDVDLRKEVITAKVASGLAHLLSQDDYDDFCRAQLQHAWNRASIAVREEFAELIGESHMGIIDA
tara:strand:+ start:4069 stop:4614 length:546 start_codon:yes stop_codon:yes gene_type:complete